VERHHDKRRQPTDGLSEGTVIADAQGWSPAVETWTAYSNLTAEVSSLCNSCVIGDQSPKTRNCSYHRKVQDSGQFTMCGELKAGRVPNVSLFAQRNSQNGTDTA
jgi:hypothetical protein